MPSRATTGDEDEGEGDAPDGPVLYCYLGTLRPIASLLSAISFSNRANVEVLEDGLRFDVDIGKTVKGQSISSSYQASSVADTGNGRARVSAERHL